ncbi:uncharacterized protein LAESUDRAFT_710465 [Laetiporus sulphureus 93-53]|uniref:Uncharacterized protein n=1 Tax=Laetiporus sulphureus 93-53 TaxID=1314785 RepID=A0A165HMK6_9APHY|nr:uncharacterized protein LAESUDRAFT_710465 [Laetiporus sulphureus 93-53]KZT11932.1 hypothetical protein LAESUDRAFT_710465 [Laetiporus sulphureus 93-53]
MYSCRIADAKNANNAYPRFDKQETRVGTESRNQDRTSPPTLRTRLTPRFHRTSMRNIGLLAAHFPHGGIEHQIGRDDRGTGHHRLRRRDKPVDSGNNTATPGRLHAQHRGTSGLSETPYKVSVAVNTHNTSDRQVPGASARDANDKPYEARISTRRGHKRDALHMEQDHRAPEDDQEHTASASDR